MDFNLNPDQLAIREMVKDFAEKEIAPFANEWDEKHFFPVEVLKKAASLGLGAIYVRSDVGGSELSRLDGVLIFEELAMACPTTAAYLSIHNMATWLIDTYADAHLRHTWLPKLASMQAFSSYCLTEPDSGSDAASLKTTAVRDGDDYILNGSKAFICGGSVSDVYGVWAVRVQKDQKALVVFSLKKIDRESVLVKKKKKWVGTIFPPPWSFLKIVVYLSVIVLVRKDKALK